MERADYAYSAVAVGAGTSDVVLRHRPDSVRYGLLLTVASAVVLGRWLLSGWALPARARSSTNLVPALSDDANHEEEAEDKTDDQNGLDGDQTRR